jgi:hypothetical protein
MAASAADALVAAGTIRQWRLRRFERRGGLSTGGRWTGLPPTGRQRTRWSTCWLADSRAAEAATLLEKTLTWAADISTMFELCGARKDRRDLFRRARAARQGGGAPAAPGRADAEGRRASGALADIEMCRPGTVDLSKRIDNLLALADLAGDPAGGDSPSRSRPDARCSRPRRRRRAAAARPMLADLVTGGRQRAGGVGAGSRLAVGRRRARS